MQREINRQIKHEYGYKSSAALRLQYEQGKLDRKKHNREMLEVKKTAICTKAGKTQEKTQRALTSVFCLLLYSIVIIMPRCFVIY
jgi:hypothetical protein